MHERMGPSGSVVSHCELCSQHAPVKHVSFHQNIGVLVMRFSSSVQGFLCRECIEREFWRRSAVTLVFGPWGIISFFVTPVFLVMNIASYLGATSLPRAADPAPVLGSPSAPRRSLGPWLLLPVAAVVLGCPLGCCIWSIASAPSTSALADACEGRSVPSAAPLPRTGRPGIVPLVRDSLGWYDDGTMSLPSSMRRAESTEEASLVLCLDEPAATRLETCTTSGGRFVERTVLTRRGRVIAARTGEVIGEATLQGDEPPSCEHARGREGLEGEDPILRPERLADAFGPFVESAQP
jgi:hypothetical protein